MSRDTPENRALWGPNGVGSVDVAASVCAPDNECPFYHYSKDSNDGAFTTPIHLLIASFRDRLCPRTLFNAFERAQNPKRIYIRVLDQTEPDSDLIDDAGCWERYCQDYNTNCSEYKSQVRIVHQDSRTAKGPTDARSKLSAMVYWDYMHPNAPNLQPVQLQDFCMQTDSHMDFSDNFDTELIWMHHRTRNDYAVLSTYVTSMEMNNQNPPNYPNLCMCTFTSTIRNWGTKECRNLVTPKLTNAMWGAGLSFHRCHAEINVPVDPYLDGVFDGEEGSRGIRFFTHGYDVYTPDRVLVTHDYKGHQSNPVVHTWGGGRRGRNNNNNKQEQQQQQHDWLQDIEQARDNVRTVGTKRVNMMLGIGKKEYSDEELQEIKEIRQSRFGLGTKRTLEQVRQFTGIDLVERKMVENKCGNLIWVPFVESPNYGIQATLERGLTDGNSGRAVTMPVVEPTSSRFEITNGVKLAGVLVLFLMAMARYSRQRRKKRDRHKN